VVDNLAVQEQTFTSMGTSASLLVVTDDVREFNNAVADVERILQDVSRRFNSNDPNSEVSLIRRGGPELTKISDDMERVLDGCRIVEAMTEGAFRARTPAGELDPAGFVKGWGMKRAGAALHQRGLENWCLTVGGDVVTRGCRGERDWHVAVGRPENSSIAAVVEVSGQAVATSGERIEGPGGASRAHIWDTADRVRSAPGSMTVIGPSIDIADALATGCWALGDAAFDVLAKLPEYHLIRITQDKVLVSAGFPFPTRIP
jgi:thiamine biosynthesis lipoprotein